MRKKHYVIIRNDLVNYSVGALVAQGIHATLSAFFTFYTAEVEEYLSQGEKMTTVVLQCTKKELEELSCELTKNEVEYKEWREQPENEMTALSLLPIDSSHPAIAYIKKLRLFK
ncbi:hypothetical protein NEFER03_1090 [Nematocida sp. LUAm3]|nr:hypothetical protein NEFER03_1090 [Nematocida sp. LUAm3]KAI5175305.1 hypothetical protein NEFER02_1234 [Nematocida sp. LUAm2]KAI5177738.1 hypothetical protein NEFER01_0962 [Nematocida sp. LUAm1]